VRLLPLGRGFGRGGAVDAPGTGDASEFPFSAVFEKEARAGDQILHRLRDEHLARAGGGGDPETELVEENQPKRVGELLAVVAPVPRLPAVDEVRHEVGPAFAALAAAVPRIIERRSCVSLKSSAENTVSGGGGNRKTRRGEFEDLVRRPTHRSSRSTR